MTDSITLSTGFYNKQMDRLDELETENAELKLEIEGDRPLVDHPMVDKWDQQIREMCIEWTKEGNRLPEGSFDAFVDAYNKCLGR